MTKEPLNDIDESQQAGRKAHRLLGLPLAVGLGVAVGVVILSAWFASEVSEGETLSFDLKVREAVHQIASPPLTRAMIAFSFIGSPAVLVALGLAAFMTFLFIGWRRAALIFLITMSGELVIDLVLKATYMRVRPDPYFDYVAPLSFSFPSGHALGSLCFFGILAWLITSRLDNAATVWAIRTIIALLVLLIGLSRIYLGVHYPTDVLAGYLAGTIWTTAVVIASERFRPPDVR